MKELIDKLNQLLSAYQVAFFNARSSHWMIKGGNFFELHKVFETSYNDANEKIDAIAERILTLGGRPLLRASELIKNSRIKEKKTEGEESACVKDMLDDLTRLAVIEKEAVKISERLGDVVTADLLTGYMGQQQKTSWMLYQFLSKKSKIS